jgi:hypothetical protein
MTPRSLLLITIPFSVLFWLGLLSSKPTALAQLDSSTNEPVVDSALSDEDPVLTFTVREPVVRGIPAHFTATVSIDPDAYTYTWAFGDGSTAQGRLATHTYQSGGDIPVSVFPVSVSATRNGQRLEASRNIEVHRDPPVVPIEGLVCTQDGPVEANNPVRLAASVARGEPVTYSWSVGQPGVPPLDGPVVTHRYPGPGIYRAIVTARNPVTPGVTCAVDITVFDETIAGLEFTWTGKPQVRLPVQFEATIVRGTNVSYEWFFGDGGRATGSRATHPFNRLGFHEVTVVASNSRNTLQRTRTVMVVPPTPHLIGSSNNGPKAIGVPLTAFASMQGETPETRYAWRWGDGSSAALTTASSASHEYKSAGAYGIQVIAYNDGGAMAHTNIAYIGDDAPLPTLLITHSFATDLMIPVSRPVTLTAIFEPAQPELDYDDFDFHWNWGDGNFTTGRSPRLSHTYLSSNNFVARVTATQRTTATTAIQLYGATVVLVAPNIYLPLMAQNSSFVAASPSDGPNASTPTDTPTPIPTDTPTPTATPTSTDEIPPPLPSPVDLTPSPTATATIYNPTPMPPTAPPTEAPTATDTPIPTPTTEEGGTIPPLPG